MLIRLLSFTLPGKTCCHFSSWGVLVFFLFAGTLSAQDRTDARLPQQLIVSCDNNAFLLNDDDGYYTSGFFLKYDRVRGDRQTGSPTSIFSYEVGHMIYNAHQRKILAAPTGVFPGGVSEIDRPVTGYLFASATRSSFYRKNRLLRVGASVGIVGENAFGKQVQESWHKVIGIKQHWNWVWDYQLRSEVGANIHGVYAFAMFSRPGSWIQMTPVTQASVGTLTTQVSQALVFQTGKFRPTASSSYWQSRILSSEPANSRNVEFFFFYKPQITWQLYNATIQGGMIRQDKGPITSELRPIVFSQDIGVRFSNAKYCLGYHVTLQTREAKSQIKSHVFANIFCALRF